MTAPVFQIVLGVGVLSIAPAAMLVVFAGSFFLRHGQSLAYFGRGLVKGFHKGNMRQVAGEVKR